MAANPTDFAFINFVRDWPELQVGFNQLEIRLRRDGRPVAADMLLAATRRTRQQLERLEIEMAAFATEELRRQEHDTRVRPDTGGEGGNRLGDALVAEPLKESLMPGSVGVANQDLLDQKVPWWITNERGSSARVGGVLFGIFWGRGSGGGAEGAVPDAGQFREHPLFAPAPASMGGGRGVIENPIPARHFVAKAVAVINAEWHRRFDTIKAQLDAELEQAVRNPT